MNKFHKFSFFILVIFTSFFLFSCKAKSMDVSDKVKITTTIFPYYEWVHELSYTDNNVSDNTILTLVIKSGIDYHSYKPADVELKQISSSDLFIYTGGETENWAKEIAANPTNKNQISINLMDVLNDSTHTENIDEHVWLSLKNAELFCKVISESLCKINPDYASVYEKRLYDYLLKLEKLDASYENEIKTRNRDTVLICDRNPFYYLFSDYNLNYYSAIEGCNKDLNISEEKTEFLKEKIGEYDIKAILVTEESDKKTAKNLVLNSKNAFGDVYTLDSFQSTTLRDAFNGKTYLKTMEKNLYELLKVLD